MSQRSHTLRLFPAVWVSGATPFEARSEKGKRKSLSLKAPTQLRAWHNFWLFVKRERNKRQVTVSENCKF